MGRLVTVCLLLALSAVLATADDKGQKMKDEPTTKVGRGVFTIGKDTTYATKPLDKDGYPDYVAALNERLREGVTPDNNAIVLICKALGPNPAGTRLPDEYFKLLGIDRPPEAGDYFKSLSSYVKIDLGIVALSAEAQQVDHESDEARRHIWKAADYPRLAGWLKANEKPLAAIVEATRRERYYSPVIVGDNSDLQSGLLGAMIPTVMQCRSVAAALAARALLQVGEGEFNDAWQDLLACHRLARLVGNGNTMIQGLVAYATEAVAARGSIAFLESAKPTREQLEQWSNDVAKLPLTAPIGAQLDGGERLGFLEAVLMIDRHGLRVLNNALDETQNPFPGVGDAALQGIHWDPALKNANRWFDRLAAASRIADRTLRKKKMLEIDNDLSKLQTEIASAKAIALLAGDADANGKAIGDILITLLVPAVRKVQTAADRTEQIEINLRLAFALAGYRLDHHAYPKELNELAPKYLAGVPNDVFSGKPLIYKPNEMGYLLYSVGPNGIDDGGHGLDDEPRGDDVVVRMPSAK